MEATSVFELANIGPRTDKLCWTFNASELQLETVPVQIVELEVITWICGATCVVKIDGRLPKLKRVVAPPDKA